MQKVKAKVYNIISKNSIGKLCKNTKNLLTQYYAYNNILLSTVGVVGISKEKSRMV